MTSSVATMELDTLLKSLGPNKITIPIHRNDACELHVYKLQNTKANSVFDDMEDLLITFRGNRSTGTPKNATTSRNNNTAKQNIGVANDQLLNAIACQVDPSLTLYSGQELAKKLEVFRNMLHDNLDNFHDAYKKVGFKKYKMTVEDVKECIKNPNREDSAPLFVYIAHLLQCNVVVDATNEAYTYPNDRFMKIHKTSYGGYEFEMHETGFAQAYHTLQSKVATDVCKDLSEQKLKNMLVKDLVEVATKLKIPTTKVGEDGKKKSLLKAELLTEIERHIASLK